MRGRIALEIALVSSALWWSLASAEPPPPPFGEPPGPPPGDVRFGTAGPGGPMFFEHHVEMGEGPGPMLPLILRHARLTPEQHEKVQHIMEADRDNLHKLFKQLEQENEGLSDKLFAAGDVKFADVKPQLTEIADLRRQLMEQGVKTTLAIRAVLTPAQLAKVTDLKQRIDKLHAEMRQLMERND